MEENQNIDTEKKEEKKECYIHTKKILLEAKRKIESVPNWSNHISKMNLIEGYANLLDYYKAITGKKDEDCKDLELDNDAVIKYDKYVIKKTKQKLEELGDLAPYLSQRFERLINLYKENGFCSFDFVTNFHVSPKDLFAYLEEFLNILGSDVCDLYNKIILSDGFFLHNKLDELGASLNTIAIDNPRMIVQNVEKDLDFYSTIVHEIGHCYQYYLQRNHLHFEAFNPFMETTSIFFEKLFFEFLKTKKKYNRMAKDAEVFEHIYFLNNLSASRILCALMMSNTIGQIEPFSLKYSPLVDKEILLDEMLQDCGYIMENKRKIELTEFHYSIGNVIAAYFLEKTKSDFRGTLKEYKDFICTADDYPLKEILDKYFNMDLMEDNIKTFINSYHSR